MKTHEVFSAALNPGSLMKRAGMQPDAWQEDLLRSQDRMVLLNCCRQAGKSTVVSALALHTALFNPGSLTVILSPVQRQSTELFHKILELYNANGRPLQAEYETQLKIHLSNGSRIICLPGKEETVRCYTPSLMVIDEASRVTDNLYRAVRPSLAVSGGRLAALSTPYGQRGWFFREWKTEGPWKKVKITWRDCPRISKDWINDEKRAMGNAWVEQEYECAFTALEGLVYPDFGSTHTDLTNFIGKPVGGIDWGWRNPFAAVWGYVDHDDVLWINDERYLRETALHLHAKGLPKHTWYADPAGRTEIEEFRAAGHVIRRGNNDIELGIAAVTARIRTGRLKVNNLKCPNLCEEATLYRYPEAKDRAVMGEKPIDEHNHALGALRYLVSRLDGRFMARLRRRGPKPEGPIEVDRQPEEQEKTPVAASNVITPDKLDWSDDKLWTRR
jgi:hypothetical protein